MIEKHLEQICNAFQDAICITDKNGIIVLTNKKYADAPGKLLEGNLFLKWKDKGFSTIY